MSIWFSVFKFLAVFFQFSAVLESASIWLCISCSRKSVMETSSEIYFYYTRKKPAKPVMARVGC
ncbi:hypothetical protein, partial [Mitsuokella jalaludinii]|uniref:hypothetical protein n=1 Tax=Mitsuokella jalaludinii TaxID=187979 RepID=UPI00307E9D4F